MRTDTYINVISLQKNYHRTTISCHFTTKYAGAWIIEANERSPSPTTNHTCRNWCLLLKNINCHCSLYMYMHLMQLFHSIRNTQSLTCIEVSSTPRLWNKGYSWFGENFKVKHSEKVCLFEKFPEIQYAINTIQPDMWLIAICKMKNLTALVWTRGCTTLWSTDIKCFLIMVRALGDGTVKSDFLLCPLNQRH